MAARSSRELLLAPGEGCGVLIPPGCSGKALLLLLLLLALGEGCRVLITPGCVGKALLLYGTVVLYGRKVVCSAAALALVHALVSSGESGGLLLLLLVLLLLELRWLTNSIPSPSTSLLR